MNKLLPLIVGTVLFSLGFYAGKFDQQKIYDEKSEALREVALDDVTLSAQNTIELWIKEKGRNYK